MKFFTFGRPTVSALFVLRSCPMTTRPLASLKGFLLLKSYSAEWQMRQSMAFSASGPLLPTSLRWLPGWQVLQPVNFVFPVSGLFGISFRLFTMSLPLHMT